MSLLNNISNVFELERVKNIATPGLNDKRDVVRNVIPLVHDIILDWSIPIVMEEVPATIRTSDRALNTLKGKRDARNSLAKKIVERNLERMHTGDKS